MADVSIFQPQLPQSYRWWSSHPPRANWPRRKKSFKHWRNSFWDDRPDIKVEQTTININIIFSSHRYEKATLANPQSKPKDRLWWAVLGRLSPPEDEDGFYDEDDAFGDKSDFSYLVAPYPGHQRWHQTGECLVMKMMTNACQALPGEGGDIVWLLPPRATIVYANTYLTWWWECKSRSQ